MYMDDIGTGVEILGVGDERGAIREEAAIVIGATASLSFTG